MALWRGALAHFGRDTSANRLAKRPLFLRAFGVDPRPAAIYDSARKNPASGSAAEVDSHLDSHSGR
jgi:hypothetical protein